MSYHEIPSNVDFNYVNLDNIIIAKHLLKMISNHLLMQELNEVQNPLQCCSPLLFCRPQAASLHKSACTQINSSNYESNKITNKKNDSYLNKLVCILVVF